MSPLTLILRTLLFHWRMNLAVLAGVIAGTAVVGGAQIVGDSVRGSLRDMTLVRLGMVDYVLNGPRFFREQLAGDLAALPEFESEFSQVAPAIVLDGTLERPAPEGNSPTTGESLSRAGRVAVYGVGPAAWDLMDHGDQPLPSEGQVLLGPALARQLNAKTGDSITLTVELPSDIPRDSLLGKRDETSVVVPLTISGILPESSGAGRFGLQPDQQLPRNAFVSLKGLQQSLGLGVRRASRRDARELPPRVNALFVSARNREIPQGQGATAQSDVLNRLVTQAWQLDDFHLRTVVDEPFGYFAVESERMIIERPIVQAAESVAERLRAPVSPVLVYIANEISKVTDQKAAQAADQDSSSKGSPAYSRYSVVAGVESSILTAENAKPFGPFVFNGPEPGPQPTPDTLPDPGTTGAIIINDWLANDLRADVGDVLRLTYHVVGSHGELPDEERRFEVRGIVKLDGTIAADRGIVPEVRGITDVKSFDEWDSPFPMKKVTRRDDEYWEHHRATPKAFISLEAAQHLWQSRYGDLTSIRIGPAPEQSLAETESLFTRAVLEELQPQQLGLSFQPVKFLGLQAASGTTDFGGLFFGFSFFLILSAAILIGLLFRLGIERRASEIGLLQSVGFGPKQVWRLVFGEAWMIVLVGAVAGTLFAAGYAALMIHGLKTWWIGAIGTRFLELHLLPASLATGAGIAIFVAILSIWWGIRGMWRVAPRALLTGTTQSPLTDAGQLERRNRGRRLSIGLGGIAAGVVLVTASGLIPSTEAFAGLSWPTVLFFVVGMLTLTAGILALGAWLDSDRAAVIRGAGFAGTARLGLRNAARNRSRSLLSAGLVATATFLIVAIAAGHRNPALERPDKLSGNGGFTLVADSSVPILYDLNTGEGRDKLGLSDAILKNPAAKGTLDEIRQVVAFRSNPGENASCLNIYQTSQPTILGVPTEMIERGGFKFIGPGAGNPWEKLHEVEPDGTIPVFGDMNTLQYSLHIGMGQTLELRDEFQQKARVRIAGMLDSSVFQGVLMMDDAQFRKLFPSRAGAQYFLIDTPLDQSHAVADLLESNLPGFDAERVADRLASFLAVQNTYLSTFQALGGLGLLLGTIGLATVMLRNVLERRSELALLRAVGFRDSGLAWLVLCENALLLAWGLACGTISALLAMLPHLMTIGADVPWANVALILGGVFVTGTLAALAAVRSAVHTPVLETLRGS